MSGNHGHDHTAGLADHRGRLAVVLGITVTVLIVEVVGAVISGSLALLADAGHMLTDVAGLSMALVAATLSRRPATPFRTWGFLRAEILGAAAQALLLLAVGVFILIEAIQRLRQPPEVTSDAVQPGGGHPLLLADDGIPQGAPLDGGGEHPVDDLRARRGDGGEVVVGLLRRDVTVAEVDADDVARGGHACVQRRGGERVTRRRGSRRGRRERCWSGR